MEDRRENISYGLNEPYQDNAQHAQQTYGQNNAQYEQQTYGQNANIPYDQNMPYGSDVQYGQPQYNQPQYNQTQYSQPQYNQPQYNQPQYNQPQYSYPVRAVVRDTMSERNGAGVAGFVIACFALLCCWIPIFDLVFAIIGIVCSAIGLGKDKKTGRGLAVAGLVLSIISLILSLIICFLFILGMSL